jgi:PKD repeat protein
MKNFVVLISLFFCSFIVAQTTKKVLFIGNSYTYYNDLPSLIDSLANHNGNDLIKDQNTPGGYTFEAHTTNTTTLSKISSDTWDFVILQEQSQLPSFPYNQVQTDVLPYAKILCDSIRSANDCAKPLFYGTWGRRDGDSQWDSINTFEKMNNRLYNTYEYMADVNNGKLAPVGIGFRYVKEDGSAPISHTQLYSSDGSHPSILGSYLGACIFYNIIFNSTSTGNTYVPNGVSTPEAQYIQFVADHVTYDVDSLNLDFTLPVADYTTVTNGFMVNFTNQSQHAYTYLWDFGDGTTSIDVNPTHQYTQVGNFNVTLTATYCQNNNQYMMPVSITDNTSSIKSNQEETFKVYIDYNSNQIVIKTYLPNQIIYVYNTNGQLIKQLTSETTHVTLDDFQNGMYFIKVNQITKKIVIKN